MRSPFENSDLQLDAPDRGPVYNNAMETLGNTPLVRLARHGPITRVRRRRSAGFPLVESQAGR